MEPPRTDETRKSIVRAARRVFSQRGYDGTTFQEIADCADLARPAIDYYFSSKRALYREVVDRTNRLVVEAVIERALRETSLTARIAALITVAADSDSQNPSTAAFLAADAMESQRHPDLNPAGNDAVRTARRFLTWAVDDAIEHGELTTDIDAALLVETLMVVSCGMAFYAGFVESYRQIDAVAESVRHLLAADLLKLSQP
ncbi:TetR/AcrR family transcriptional regulator [Mycobacterium spongiae]|uniref:TetR family transcriptional regulator n=1 Tax=Mycobacterium spongiae TaxID=886343 RepID=A0A975JWA2_9MYCO|nr:TetR/AcrR family transcriptional regulator [Mycobacterium spongiae]QUR66515.1 TetR family transcriptional regulator [Mycobacterium spongiae]